MSRSKKVTKFPSEEARKGFEKFVILQFEMVWNAALAEQGIAQAGEVKAGVSHPDFGKKWSELKASVKDFITALHYYRLGHFQDLYATATLDTLLQIGSSAEVLTPELEAEIAERFHEDWLAVRQELYSATDEAAKQALRDGGVKPYGEHEGDIPWNQETPAQKLNDLRLVSKMAWLLSHVAASSDPELLALLAFVRS